MRTKLLFILCLSLSVARAGADASHAYHLHQAINYLNLYADGRCERALDDAKTHLAMLSKEKGDESLMKIFKETVRLEKPTRADLSQFESIRLEFSEYLEKTKIEHKMSWHKEIRTNCPNAPPIE